jgi:hypothetical protein
LLKANKIKTLKINNLRMSFNRKHQSIAWGNSKNREKMLILSYLWLLDKYKDYPEIKIHNKNIINNIIRDLKCYSSEELYNDLVNEVSCETLNIIQGEEEMKNVLIGGLIVLLMSGLLVSCPEKPEEKEGNSHNGLTVAEEYRGDWYESPYLDTIAFQLTSSEYIPFYQGSKSTPVRPAWTVENELWTYSSSKDTKRGTFTDNSTYVESTATYVKK